MGNWERGGCDERVSAPKNAIRNHLLMVFSGSAGDNEGGAGTLESLRQLQTCTAVETRTRLETFLTLPVPMSNLDSQPCPCLYLPVVLASSNRITTQGFHISCSSQTTAREPKQTKNKQTQPRRSCELSYPSTALPSSPYLLFPVC